MIYLLNLLFNIVERWLVEFIKINFLIKFQLNFIETTDNIFRIEFVEVIQEFATVEKFHACISVFAFVDFSKASSVMYFVTSGHVKDEV